MGTLTLALVFASCFMHAGWNLLVRGQQSGARFIGRMLAVTTALGFLPACAAEWFGPPLPPLVWACLAGSGICCGVYYLALARAYASSDFTIVYPVARALPVLLVAAGDAARGRWPAPGAWIGMSLVVLGCFLAPLHSFRDIQPRQYLKRSVAWMLLAALGTVGYTLLDKVASEAVTRGPAAAARYGYFFLLVAHVVYAGLLKALGHGDNGEASTNWRLPAIAAVMNFGAYWLVLWAYQLAHRASYVLAFRQFSILVGVAAAFILYKEKGLAIRLTGALLITAGLVLIGVLGR